MTLGPIRGHVLRVMAFMLTGLVVQTLYSLVDIYWVSRLGQQAVAAVSVCSNLMFITIAISQALGVGAVALVSQSFGRKDGAGVQRHFNQAQSLSIFAGVLFLILGSLAAPHYTHLLSGDATTERLANQFLVWFIPTMALQFTMVGLASSLRGIGNMRPGLLAQVGSVLLNMALAPFLIFGWLGLPQMGVQGAGLASFIGSLAAVAGLVLYLRRDRTYLRVDTTQWRPDWKLWRRMLSIGLPAGSEFLIMSAIIGLIYGVIARFGAEAQAGFGIGMRIMQAGFMPAVALSFGVAAVAGQNFGAGQFARVRESFAEAAKIAIGFMLFFTVICQVSPEALMGFFTHESAVIVVGADYLRFISFTYVASALSIVAGGVFQGLGNTLPSLLASASRLIFFILPVLWLSQQPDFNLHQVWVCSIVSVSLQMVLALLLLRRELARKLGPVGVPAAAVA